MIIILKVDIIDEEFSLASASCLRFVKKKKKEGLL